MLLSEKNSFSTDKINDDTWKEYQQDEAILRRGLLFGTDKAFLALTPIQQRFIAAYQLYGTKGFTFLAAYRYATQKDIDAYIASPIASRLKNDPKIKKFTDRIDKIRLENSGFSVNALLENELSIVYSDITAYIDEDGFISSKKLKDLPASQRQTIKTIEFINDEDGVTRTKVTLHDKGKALARVERINGMYDDKISVISENINANLEIKGDMDSKESMKRYTQMLKGTNG